MLENIRDAFDGYSKRTLNVAGRSLAGVMILLYEKFGEVYIVLQKRSDHVGDHKGEISLPGGRKENSDGSILDTALRETYEEIGISSKDIELFGELDDFSTLSKYIISPFVGAINHPYDFFINTREVDEIIEMPISILTNELYLRHEARLSSGSLEFRKAFGYEGHFIWGATAKVLERFLEIISQAGYPWKNTPLPINKKL